MPGLEELRVLVVDDSLTIRAMMDELISHLPHCQVVGAAANVAEAREMIATRFPNLITLDLAMPGINGVDFLDELAHHSHAPVVVVSSSTAPGSVAAQEALDHGADACFDKSCLLRRSKTFLSTLRKAATHPHHIAAI